MNLCKKTEHFTLGVKAELTMGWVNLSLLFLNRVFTWVGLGRGGSGWVGVGRVGSSFFQLFMGWVGLGRMLNLQKFQCKFKNL